MSSQSPRRTLAVAVLLALLAVTALPAQPLTVGERSVTVPSLGNLLERLWSMIGSWFEKEGMTIDPDGRNNVPPPPPSGDAGMTIDPDGIHAAGGEGVITDPNG